MFLPICAPGQDRIPKPRVRLAPGDSFSFAMGMRRDAPFGILWPSKTNSSWATRLCGAKESVLSTLLGDPLLESYILHECLRGVSADHFVHCFLRRGVSAPSSLVIEHITLVSGIMEPLVTPPYAANRLVPAKVGCQISHKSGVRLVHKLSDLLLQISEWQGQPKNSFQQTLRDDRTDWPAAPAGWARLALASWLSLEATEDCIGVYD